MCISLIILINGVIFRDRMGSSNLQQVLERHCHFYVPLLLGKRVKEKLSNKLYNRKEVKLELPPH